MLPLVGSVVLNMAKAEALKKVLALGSGLAEQTIDGIKAGISSSRGEDLVSGSLEHDSTSQNLLVYSRYPKSLREDAARAAESMNKVGGDSSVQSVTSTLALISGISSIGMALSTSFAKDHKSILKAIAPGFEGSMSKIMESTASNYFVAPKIGDLFSDKKLASGFKTGHVETIVAALSSVMPVNVISNCGFILNRNEMANKKYGPQEGVVPNPKPHNS